MLIDRTDPTQYCAFFCEENIWRLCASHRVTGSWVLIISNFQHRVAMWQQRAAAGPEQPLVWDYHVVLCAPLSQGWQVLDVDSRLPCPLPLEHYLRRSFPHASRVPPPFQPLFKPIAAEHYLRTFSSDRRHMRADGAWLRPPPEWPPIGHGHGLETMTDMRDHSHGPVIERDQLADFLAAQTPVASHEGPCMGREGAGESA